MYEDYARLKLSRNHLATETTVWQSNQVVQNLLDAISLPVGACDAEWDSRGKYSSTWSTSLNL